jgi:hypothetical protein
MEEKKERKIENTNHITSYLCKNKTQEALKTVEQCSIGGKRVREYSQGR